MKVLLIGDRHGYDFDRKDLDILITKYEKVIFFGDWFDSFDKSLDEQLDVFYKDMDYYNVNKNIIYLWGNNDIHYLPSIYQYNNMKEFIPICSGYQNENHIEIASNLNKHLDKFKFLHTFDNWIFSHAGLSNDVKEFMFSRYNITSLKVLEEESNFEPVALFQCFNNGNSTYDGLTWIRPETLLKSKIEGYNQVFGHTFNNNLKVKWYDDNHLCVDCGRIVELDLNTKKIKYFD